MTKTMKPYFEAPGIAIYHGEAGQVLAGMDKVDLVLTDPPYAMSGARKEWRITAEVAVGLAKAATLVKEKGAMLAFTTSSGRGIDFTLGAVQNTLRFNRTLIWHKEFVRSRVAGPWRWDVVQILCFGRASFGRPQFSSVFTSTGPASKAKLGETKHPAELPDGIGEWLYAPFDAEGMTVLDPFCGTGQLLVPAASRRRKVIGIDKEEKWCEVAAKRLAAVSSVMPPPLAAVAQ